MKSLWNAISFLAVVHLLALVMLLLWLFQSGRLNRERVNDLRQWLGTTSAEARTAAAKSIKDAEAERLATAQKDNQSHPGADSETQIQRLTLMSQQEQQTRRSMDDERTMLQQQLSTSTAQVDQKQAAFDRQRQEWENTVKIERQRRTDAQFQQTVKLYEQATPKQAKKMLEELISQKHQDQAVAYLDAMNPRAASKVLKEFKTDEEIKLATELLEKLRTLGQTSENPPTAPASTNAANSSANLPAAGQHGSSAAAGSAGR